MSDVNELQGRDPLLLTKEGRAEIIEYYRNNRVTFTSGVKQPKATTAGAKKKTDLPGLNLSDLGL